MSNTENTLTGIITNTCSCVSYNEETKYLQEETECDGLCWEYSVEDFSNVTQELRDSNNSGWWQVKNLRLWDGDFGGLFHANSVLDLIRGMTVNSEWTMRYKIYADRIEYSLSHHDAPMGSVTTIVPVNEDSRVDWGLF